VRHRRSLHRPEHGCGATYPGPPQVVDVAGGLKAPRQMHHRVGADHQWGQLVGRIKLSEVDRVPAGAVIGRMGRRPAPNHSHNVQVGGVRGKVAQQRGANVA